MTASSPRSDWGRALAVAVAVYALAYVAWTAWPISPGGYGELVNELADYPALAAAVALMLRAGSAVGAARARRGWRLLALACALWFVANGIYDYIVLVRHDEAFPSIGDLVFVGCFPVALVGLLSFPAELGSRGERIAFALDGSMLMVGGGVVILHLVLLPVASGHGALELALISYYPLADMVLALCVVAVLYRHLPARTRWPLRVLVVAFGSLFVADLVYARLTLAGTYTSTRVTDSLWTVGYSILAIAAHLQHRLTTTPVELAGVVDEPVRPGRLSSWLPVAAVIACLTVLVLHTIDPDPWGLRVVVGATVVLVALVVARMLVVAHENARVSAESAARAGEARLARERAQAAAEREQYQGHLMEAQKMEAIGRLAGGVAHDMNNALQGIVVTAELMVDEAATAEARADAETILNAASRAAELTRNLLGFARHGPARREVLRPESVVTSVVTMLARTLPKGIRVETSFAAELATIEGDPGQLYHALLNLCINGADAMSGRGVLTLGAGLVDLDASGARRHGLAAGLHVAMWVRDTGTGMDEATRARLFEPFFTTKPVGQGTGLGLAMVYGTVQRHHGAVEVDSAPGQGSTFRILIPAHAAPEPLAEPRSPAAPPAASARSSAGRVLVVDDEPLLRTMVRRVLEKHGYQVACAAHGQAGLEALAGASEPFDLVLLDMAMPVMAGPEMFRRARAVDPTLRVLLTSGFAATEDSQALLREGAYGLVGKPYTPGHLLSAIATVMRGERVTGAAVTGAAD
jgi:signal transduction histidine kinase/CheY-like chemotaxis protein